MCHQETARATSFGHALGTDRLAGVAFCGTLKARERRGKEAGRGQRRGTAERRPGPGRPGEDRTYGPEAGGRGPSRSEDPRPEESEEHEEIAGDSQLSDCERGPIASLGLQRASVGLWYPAPWASREARGLTGAQRGPGDELARMPGACIHRRPTVLPVPARAGGGYRLRGSRRPV